MTARRPRDIQGPQHFAPLPQNSFNRDELLQWLAEQTISAQKLITGSLQADQTVSSSNFSSGSAGWQIDGDGNAEFNDVTVRGDIVSSNWDGAEPADLSSVDGTATQGFYLDSSRGAAQFEGDVFVGGEITGGTVTGSLFRTATSGERLEIDGSNGESFVSLFNSSGTSVGSIGWLSGVTRLGISSAGNASVRIDSDLTLELWADGVIDVQPGASSSLSISGDTIISSGKLEVTGDQIRASDGSTGSPAYSFGNNSNTGIYRSGANQVSFAVGGSEQLRIANEQILIDDGSGGAPGLSFFGDADTGLYRNAANDWLLVAGGNQFLRMVDGSPPNTLMHGIRDDTSGGAANVTINATTGRVQRSTSSLKYKPDWRLAPEAANYELPTPIKWTDEKGQLRLGFGAEHVHKAVPEAYEEEIYDLRSLVAVLSEKVKRLEARPRWRWPLRASGS